MSCLLTAGRKEPCLDISAGIEKVLFINHVYGGLNLTFGTGDEVTDITDNSDPVQEVDAYEYEVKGASKLVENVLSDRNAGTTAFEQVLTLQLKKWDKDMTKQMKLLAYGRPHAIVVLRSGEQILCGAHEGLELGGNRDSGAAHNDPQVYALELRGMEKMPAYHVEGSLDTILGTINEGA